MRKLVVIGAVAILIITMVFAGCSAPASSPTPTSTATHLVTKVNVLTAPFGTMPYTVALAVSDVAKKEGSWLTISAAESPGAVYDLQFLQKYPDRWENTVIISTSVGDYLAAKGLPPLTEALVGTRYLIGYHISAGALWSLKPDYQTMADLKGKKVALGYETQTGFYHLPVWLFRDGYGILDTLDVSKLGPGGVRALMDGLVEAAIGYTDYVPQTNKFYPEAALLELTGSGKTVYPVGITQDILDAAKKKNPMDVGLLPATPADMDNLSRNVGMFTEVHHYTVKDVFPEDAAYEFTRTILANSLGSTNKYIPYGKSLEAFTKETFAIGMTKKNTHPGALKAFQEFGINIP